MITTNALEARVLDTVEPSLSHMGYELVQVRMQESDRRRVLQLIAERTDSAQMSVEDCEKISDRVSALLDVGDIIPGGPYQLEVSSPGLDRPLTRPKDFADYAGYEAKLELIMPMDGRKRFRGELKGIEQDEVLIRCDNTDYPILLDNIRSAKLVATDAMVEQLLKKHKQKPH